MEKIGRTKIVDLLWKRTDTGASKVNVKGWVRTAEVANK